MERPEIHNRPPAKMQLQTNIIILACKVIISQTRPGGLKNEKKRRNNNSKRRLA